MHLVSQVFLQWNQYFFFLTTPPERDPVPPSQWWIRFSRLEGHVYLRSQMPGCSSEDPFLYKLMWKIVGKERSSFYEISFLRLKTTIWVSKHSYTKNLVQMSHQGNWVEFEFILRYPAFLVLQWLVLLFLLKVKILVITSPRKRRSSAK